MLRHRVRPTERLPRRRRGRIQRFSGEAVGAPLNSGVGKECSLQSVATGTHMRGRLDARPTGDQADTSNVRRVACVLLYPCSDRHLNRSTFHGNTDLVWSYRRRHGCRGRAHPTRNDRDVCLDARAALLDDAPFVRDKGPRAAHSALGPLLRAAGENSGPLPPIHRIDAVRRRQ